MNNQNAIIYRIQPGDTLYSLAQRYNTTVEIILDANPYLEPQRLMVGDEIIIYARQNGLSVNGLTESKLNLMDNMRMFLDDHVMWMRQMIISITHDLKDIDVINQQLLKDTIDMGNLYKAYYGEEIGARLTNLFREHVLIGRELFKALKKGDMVNFDTFNRQWYRNADDIAFALDSINPYYIERDIREALYQHLDLVRQIASTRMGGNYSAEARVLENARVQAEKIADYLTDGIIEQFPKQFMA